MKDALNHRTGYRQSHPCQQASGGAGQTGKQYDVGLHRASYLSQQNLGHLDGRDKYRPKTDAGQSGQHCEQDQKKEELSQTSITAITADRECRPAFHKLPPSVR